MAQESEEHPDQQVRDADWNLLPSVGTWFQLTSFDIDAADGKVSWSALALAQLPFDNKVETLQFRARDLPAAGLDSLQRFLLCHPPRSAAWRKRCFNCLAEFKCRTQLFMHLCKFELPDKRCCMLSSAEEQFWSSLSSNEFAHTAQAAAKLGVGWRFFAGIATWLEAACDVFEVCLRFASLVLFDFDSWLAVVKPTLAKWLNLYAVDSFGDSFMLALLNMRSEKLQLFILDIAADTDLSKSRDMPPLIDAVITWSSQNSDVFTNAALCGRVHEVTRKVFSLFRRLCPGHEFCTDASARVLALAASLATTTAEPSTRSEAIGLLVQAVRARNADVDRILPATIDQVLVAVVLDPGTGTDIGSAKKELEHILQTGSRERVLALLPPLVAAALQLLCGRHPIPFAERSSWSRTRFSEGPREKLLQKAKSKPGPPWSLEKLERQGLPPLELALLLPENLEGQVLFACEHPTSSRCEAGRHALSALFDVAQRHAAELFDVLCKPGLFSGARVTLSMGQKGTVVEVAETVQLVMDDASRQSVAAQDCKSESCGLSALVNMALGRQAQSLGPCGEAVLKEQHALVPKDLRERAQLAASELVSAKPIRAAELLSSVLDLPAPADDGSDAMRKLMRSLVIALCGGNKAKLRNWLSMEGVTLVGITEAVLEAATHEVARAAVLRQLPPLLTDDFGLVPRLASNAPKPGISVRVLKVVTRLLREWHADAGCLLFYFPSFICFVDSCELLHSLVAAFLSGSQVDSRLRAWLSTEGASLVCITEGVLEAAKHEVSQAVVRRLLPPLLTADFTLVTRLASNAAEPSIGIRALKVVTTLLREWHADEGSLLDFIPSFVKLVGSEVHLLHSVVVAIFGRSQVDSRLKAWLSTEGATLVCITEGLLEVPQAVLREQLPPFLNAKFGLVTWLAKGAEPATGIRVLKVITKLLEEWHADEGSLLDFIPTLVESAGTEVQLLHSLILLLLRGNEVDSKLRTILKTEGASLLCMTEAVLEAANHEICRPVVNEHLPPFLTADFGLVTRLARILAQNRLLRVAAEPGMGIRIVKVVTRLLREWHADEGLLLSFFPSVVQSVGSEVQLLHSLVVALFSGNPPDSRLRTWLGAAGASLVYITEGVLEAAKNEASQAALRQQLPPLMTADFGLVSRLTNVSEPGVGIRVARVMERVLRKWPVHEGTPLQYLPLCAAWVGSEVKLFYKIVTALLSRKDAAVSLQTLLSIEGSALVCVTEGVLAAATHEESRAVVHEQLPPLLTADFGLVGRLASLWDRGICVRLLTLVLKLLREWHADEGSLAFLIPDMFQSLGIALPINPGAQTLAAVVRCLSQRNIEVLDQLVQDTAVVMIVVQHLNEHIERRTRDLRYLLELIHELLGPEEEQGYATRLGAFEIWGITETELQMPGQRRAPELVVAVGEDVLRSSLPHILRAQVGSLQPRRLKFQFAEGIGADYGGLRRAFLARAGAELCSARLNLLLPAEQLYFQLSPVPGLMGSPDLRDNPQDWCKFLGRLLGIAVVHEEPMGVPLVPSLCKALVSQEPSFSDLQYVDASWHTSLSSLSRVALQRLPSATVDEILEGQSAEISSKPAFIFDALVSHIENAGDYKVELAEMLLRAAATSLQRRDAVEAADKVLQSSSTAQQERLLAFASTLPHSQEVDKFMELARGTLGTAGAEEASSEKAVPSGKGSPSGKAGGKASGKAPPPGKAPPGKAPPGKAPPGKAPAPGKAGGKGPGKAPPPKAGKGAPGSERATTGGGEAPLPSGTPLAPPPLAELIRAKSVVDGCGITAGEPLHSKNVDKFREAVTKKLLLDNLQPHLRHICEEFRAVVSCANKTWSWEEIQRIIAGAPVDVPSWKRLTTYTRGHSADAPVISWWWELLEENGETFQRRVFTFATGYASMPPGGIKFTMALDNDERKLPSASTCTSTMYLPAYSSREVLREKLEWMLTEQGFHLV